MSIEFVVVEDNKLQAAVTKAIDQAEAVMPSLTTMTLISKIWRSPEATTTPMGIAGGVMMSKTPRLYVSSIKSCWTRSKGRSDIHFEPYEKLFRIRTRLDGVLKK